MFDIFFCAEYPIEDINFSTRVYHEGSEKWRPALADNIREQGLVNPLIILNHRGEGYTTKYLKTGNNRLWALKELGWTHVPCIVTGSCDHPCIKVTLKEAESYFKDGRLVCKNTSLGKSLVLRDVCKPEDRVYPT